MVAARNTSELQLALLWETLLGVRPVGVHDSFFDLGGDPSLAERLMAKVKDLTGRSLSLPKFLERPTIERLGDMIKRTHWSPYWTSLVAIREGGAKPPLFFVHAPRGYVFLYYHVASHLGSDQPVYGLQAVGVDRKRTPHFRFQDMAAHYIREMRLLQPQGPYFLSGFCLGGVLAFEIARQLQAQGSTIGLLALIDAYPAIRTAPTEGSPERSHGSGLRTKAAQHIGRFLHRGTKDKLAYAIRRLQHAGLAAKIYWWNRVYSHYARKGKPLPRLFHDVYMINVRALQEYQPGPYPGKVTLLTTETDKDETFPPAEDIWSQYAGGGIELHATPHDHENLMTDPNARHVARILQQCLDQPLGAC